MGTFSEVSQPTMSDFFSFSQTYYDTLESLCIDFIKHTVQLKPQISHQTSIELYQKSTGDQKKSKCTCFSIHDCRKGNLFSLFPPSIYRALLLWSAWTTHHPMYHTQNIIRVFYFRLAPSHHPTSKSIKINLASQLLLIYIAK